VRLVSIVRWYVQGRGSPLIGEIVFVIQLPRACRRQKQTSSINLPTLKQPPKKADRVFFTWLNI